MIFHNPSGALELACNECGCRWFDRMTNRCYECGAEVPTEEIAAYEAALRTASHNNPLAHGNAPANNKNSA